MCQLYTECNHQKDVLNRGFFQENLAISGWTQGDFIPITNLGRRSMHPLSAQETNCLKLWKHTASKLLKACESKLHWGLKGRSLSKLSDLGDSQGRPPPVSMMNSSCSTPRTGTIGQKRLRKRSDHSNSRICLCSACFSMFHVPPQPQGDVVSDQ